MDRINGANTTDIGGGKRGFRDENPVAGVVGTDVDANFLNGLQENLANVIERRGLNLNSNDWDLLWKALFIKGRLPFLSAKGQENEPPAVPVQNEIWIVGTAPTGAWSGHATKLAEWTGSQWTFLTPTPWMLVGLADKTDRRWDPELPTPAWINWEGSSTERGPVRFATQAEVDVGARGVAVEPKALQDGVREVTMTMTSGQLIPNNVMTTPAITYDKFEALDSTGASIAQLVIGARDAGLWLAAATAQYSGSGNNKGLRIHKNGLANGYDGNSRFGVAQNGVAASNDTYSVCTVVRLVAGDRITVELLHTIGSTQTLTAGRAQFVRLGP